MKNRTNGLWNPPTNDNTGYYQGYYGDLVGSGINININSIIFLVTISSI